MKVAQLNLKHPLVKFVFSCKNCDGRNRKTDLSRRIITNPDAIIILLYALGPFGLNEIRHLSALWKGGKDGKNWALQTYFGPTMGYTGVAFLGNKKYLVGFSSGGAWAKDPLWYRMSETRGKRYVNGLALAGMNRLSEMKRAWPEVFASV